MSSSAAELKKQSEPQGVMELSDTLETPFVPSYVRTITGQLLPLSVFEEHVLRRVGSRWVESLVKKARAQKAIGAR